MSMYIFHQKQLMNYSLDEKKIQFLSLSILHSMNYEKNGLSKLEELVEQEKFFCNS